MDTVVIQVLVFLTILMLFVGIKGLLRRAAPTTTEENPHPVWSMFANEVASFGRLVTPVLQRGFPDKEEQLKKNIVAANLDRSLTTNDVYGGQALLCLCLGFLGFFIVFIAGGTPRAFVVAILFGALVGWMYPSMWLHRVASTRRDTIARDLPYAIDLVTVSMEAGQDFGASVRYLVTNGLTGPLAFEFSRMLHQTELGSNRSEALRRMAERVQSDDFSNLVTAVIQSMESGGSLVGTLRLQAEDIRRQRFHRAERKAARAPSLMIIPVALFILPAVFIVIFTPVGIRILESMNSMR